MVPVTRAQSDCDCRIDSGSRSGSVVMRRRIAAEEKRGSVNRVAAVFQRMRFTDFYFISFVFIVLL